uniref:Uncharacterized protein n=3 Tax=Canis lupus TaxID=9612 RepID=A0A8C0NRV7_CANLF
MIVLLAEIEIRILTKQIQTGGHLLPQTASMTTHLGEVMRASETSIETFMIQTDTGMGIKMGIRMGIGMVHAKIWTNRYDDPGNTQAGESEETQGW